MDHFLNDFNNYANAHEVKMLQNQMDLLKQMVDQNHKIIEAFVQMFEEHETKFTAIQNFADSMLGFITSSKDSIINLELRMQKLEQRSNNDSNSFFSTLP